MRSFRQLVERLVYRIAGLPVAIRELPAIFRGEADDPLRHAFASRYWRPDRALDWLHIGFAVFAWPLALLLGSAWFTARNGPLIRQRYGKTLSVQFREQIRLYFLAGVLPPWYYIFSLHQDGNRRANSFIHRFEANAFKLLRPTRASPLNDKAQFAEFCIERGIRCIGTAMLLYGSPPVGRLPDHDLFIKKIRGRGGRGAERWDCVRPGHFISVSGVRLSGEDLLRELIAKSRHAPLLVQRRLHPHRKLAEVTSGALPTVRILTCLDEHQTPEVMVAVIRTSFGDNITVDNLHAGGIGALVGLESGALSKVSDLGMDARLGWLSVHPDTGAGMEGRVIPFWKETKALALAAHRHFDDRVVIGWDIAVLDDGPIVVEGNSSPCMDIMQRFMHEGLRQHRFGELLAHHISQAVAPPTPIAGHQIAGCPNYGSELSP